MIEIDLGRGAVPMHQLMENLKEIGGYAQLHGFPPGCAVSVWFLEDQAGPETFRGPSWRECWNEILLRHNQRLRGYIKPEIRDLAGRGNVSFEEWQTLRMNGWERELLYPKLTDDAMRRVTEHMLNNCVPAGTRPFATYDKAMIGMVVPELLKRLARESK